MQNINNSRSEPPPHKINQDKEENPNTPSKIAYIFQWTPLQCPPAVHEMIYKVYNHAKMIYQGYFLSLHLFICESKSESEDLMVF